MATMAKQGMYWHEDEESKVWHVFRNGVSLCGKKMYTGHVRQDFIDADLPTCPQCIIESNAMDERAARLSREKSENGKTRGH